MFELFKPRMTLRGRPLLRLEAGPSSAYDMHAQQVCSQLTPNS